MLGQVNVMGYQVGDTSNYNLNEDQLNAALNQMTPTESTASAALALNIANAQLASGSSAQLASGSSDNSSVLLTPGICLAVLFLGVAIAK